MAKVPLSYHVKFMFLVVAGVVLIILYMFVLLDGWNLVNHEDKTFFFARSQDKQTGRDERFTTSYTKNILVDRMIENLGDAKMLQSKPFFPRNFWNMTMDELTRQLIFVSASQAKTLIGYENINTLETLPAWKLVQRNIRQFTFYSPDDPSVDQLLHDMSSLPIVEIAENLFGTQFKMNVRLSDGGWAMVKFMRYSRKVSDGSRYINFEKHFAEIAAFQLDRILGFYRIPPTVGRLINITSELEPILPEGVYNTKFTSPAGETCFYGVCKARCDREHAFCGHPDMIETSMMNYLPSAKFAARKTWDRWETYWRKGNSTLCTRIRDKSLYNDWKVYLDFIDAHTFDFLTGNFDRHNFSTFKVFGNYTFPILYDNGRGFGTSTTDFKDILSPVTQCCLIRKSTFLKYIKLYTGPEKLSNLMEEALQNDPVAPVLIKGHLTALDRRVVKVLRAVAECLQKNSIEKVVIDDRF